MKKVLRLVLVIVFAFLGLWLLVLVSNFVFYRYFQIKTEVQGEKIKYVDTKFGYSFVYPKSWQRVNPLLAQGSVRLTSDKDPQTSILFWYKDSQKIDNLNQLEVFVRDDAKWEEENFASETESIERTNLNGQEAVLWKLKTKGKTKETFHQQYYLAQYRAENVNIWIWTIDLATQNEKEPAESEKKSVKLILDSYQLLDD